MAIGNAGWAHGARPNASHFLLEKKHIKVGQLSVYMLSDGKSGGQFLTFVCHHRFVGHVLAV